MKIKATIVIPVNVEIEVPSPISTGEKINISELTTLWKEWREKVLIDLFSAGDRQFALNNKTKAKILSCSLTELEGEPYRNKINEYLSSKDEEVPPTVKISE